MAITKHTHTHTHTRKQIWWGFGEFGPLIVDEDVVYDTATMENNLAVAQKAKQKTGAVTSVVEGLPTKSQYCPKQKCS
jgi:hypothetical protein